MGSALNSVEGGSYMSMPDRSVSSASSDQKKNPRHLVLQRSSCDRVLGSVAMLCLGLAMGLMMGDLVAHYGDDPSQFLTGLQLVFFACAAIVLLIVFYQTESKIDKQDSVSISSDEKRITLPETSSQSPSDASFALTTAEANKETSNPLVEQAGQQQSIPCERVASLNENEAALLERFIMGTDRYDIVCEKLARRCLLSPRQAEVFSLLARGRNASYIEAKLCISLSTAKSHISSVYRKFGVHNQQELLALVQDALDEKPTINR